VGAHDYHIIMIKYYYKSLRTETVKELPEPKPGTWVYVETPSEAEIELLTKRFKLEPGHLQDALDEDEVPRLEREGEQTYIFVRFAYKNAEGEMDTAPLLIIIANDMVLTVSPRHLSAVDSLLNRRTAFATTQRTKLILLILSYISDQYDASLSITSRKIKAIRSRLRREQGITNQDLIDFVTLEDELNEFLASLLPTNATLRRLLAGRQLTLFEEDQDIVEDLLLNNEQSIEAIRSNLRSISNIRDAYSAISSNNLNRTITWLTIATILIALPNVFFGMYGMNIPLPFQDSKAAYPVLAGFNIAIILLIIYTVRKKRIV
jgi:magnesium transporter